MDWRTTVHLPQTEFPMRGNLPQREPEIQRWWEQIGLYDRVRAARAGRPRYVLHDGPPYANGEIHLGTALNKILKDIVVRQRTMGGFDSPYVPGWDTHGLPIERRTIETFNLDRARVSPLDLRARCRDFALGFIEVMTGQFQRLGVLGDWGHPYITLLPEYEARQIEVFGQMARKGYIYRDLKSVYWCADCETALAEAEIEFQQVRSHSIFVAFPLVSGHGPLPATAPDGRPVRVVIWTTTPWTIPSNVAVALHPDARYRLVDTEAGPLLLAADRVTPALAQVGLKPGATLGEYAGRDIEGATYRHPLFDRVSPLVLGEYVMLDEGTGAVHIAPGAGPEDFEIGRRYGLPVLVPVDEHGVFTAEAGPFAGTFYSKAEPAIIEALRAAGALLHAGHIDHSYAHCWRCHNPVLWRATQQWFVNVGAFRDEAVRAAREVTWVPAWGQDRMAQMVGDRGDWCISRQRVWGLPIPVLTCAGCGRPLLEADVIGHIAEVVRQQGADAWYRLSPQELAGPGVRCPDCGGTELIKDADIMDVWFDSGCSHAAVLAERAELTWPADVYLEGPDQYRGWFQTSLLTAVATRGTAPYRTVVTNGWVLDGQGRAMHKSLGNVIPPEDMIARYGADVLRLWVASVDYSSDVRCSHEIMAKVAEVYRKIRNTLRYLLGNLHDFDPAADQVGYEDLAPLDRWLLARTAALVDRARRDFDQFDFHGVYHALVEFCNQDLSAIFLDVRKDCLYTFPAASPARRGAQTALYQAARRLLELVAPILPHTAEEAWRLLPRRPGDPESVHLLLWEDVPAAWRDEALLDVWAGVLAEREAVARALEAARAAGRIGGSLEAAVDLYPRTQEAWARLRPVEGDLAELLIVSRARLHKPGADGAAAAGAHDVSEDMAVAVAAAAGPKCARCWRHDDTVGTVADQPEICERCAHALEAEAEAEAGAGGAG